MDGKGEDQGLEKAGNSHGKLEKLGLQEQDNHLRRNVNGGCRGNLALMDLVDTESQCEGVRGVVMDKGRSSICGEALEKSSMEKETRFVSGG